MHQGVKREDVECFCESVRLISDFIIMPCRAWPNSGLTCPAFQAKQFQTKKAKSHFDYLDFGVSLETPQS